MNLIHLNTFLGKPGQMLDFYIIRFIKDNTVQFITINGYTMCVNTVRNIHHDLTGQKFGMTPEQFQKILMFEDQITEFTAPVDTLVLHSNTIEIPILTIDPDMIPDLDTIFSYGAVTDVSVSFTPENFKSIIKYCKLMGSDDFNVVFTGDKLPMIISDQNWSIHIMPLGK